MGAAHTVLVQRTQLNRVQIQVGTVAYALVQTRGEHEAVEVGAAHTVLVQRTQLNRVQIQVVVMSTIPKRKYKRSNIEANYWNETKTF